ncbi:MAG: hypothetical protein AAF997_06405 [Myxococcota bacterium]
MKLTWFLGLLMCTGALSVGCGDSGGGDGGDGGFGGAAGQAGTGGAMNTPIEVTEDSFDCILDGTPVRKFYVKNLLGDLDASLAVANGEAELPYPPGTLLQLVPQEAMVKREVGFSDETNDWEFFFLEISADGTTIAQRGAAEAENAFGANCFACHAAAADNDFVCETDNGCDPLPIGDDVFVSLQQGDLRCE